MKIRPVILCGGAGTRLWPNSKNHQAKQFIDFGKWTLLDKTLERTKASIYDAPIISTNKKYLKQVQQHLKKNKIKNYKIVLEPLKRNTAPAILSTALIKDIPNEQPLMFFSADHLIEKMSVFNKAINKNKSKLTDQNIFIFGIKPTAPSSEYGYFVTKKVKGNINKVIKFIEKPKEAKARQVIKQKGYWNSGMFFIRKDSIINNFKNLQPTIYGNCVNAVKKAKLKSNIYYLNKASFIKATAKSFDYAILEKTKQINAIKLDIPWSDLGSWKEILKMYGMNKNKYIKKKNVFYRPWGRYTNLFEGKEFLIKELIVKPKGILSLQKHHHRAEHWLVTQGNPKITLNKDNFIKKPNEHIFIPLGSIHRIQNPGKKPVKIMEAQIGSILKETDIVRYQDVYGRVR
ncbi:mannose-6-phosphate isomerase/mannose-1-phosphate guanylyl transferase [Candidatus Pelagibacter sp. HTCC7211]|uniref:sugar phosphate nucleotidyltransferase n=1 Tax=Pelagibacter sp. (strain HTCC7211) TaxID=439493 RepID=UPI0001838CE6|nr:sugar phosphate nucleotidyltransferase [Candidatus Pelagibacter sp. HTCC7211]EDZ59883.1 mannose-6-phosphate isomerase/mannose-1-phosphate guanylyl transferase [Candidatus Pelagibacter sp. HTCC7211]MBD1150978.1 mannose-6-phosphate isomerase [Pelagibacterales bacterium SAG-MED25]